MVILANIHLAAHTGVAGVGEFVENSAEPRRSCYFSMESSISGTSAKTQGLRNEYQEVGVSHSSDEAGNCNDSQSKTAGLAFIRFFGPN